METCSYCGKEMRKKVGYTWNSEYYGKIFIPDVEYLQCECGGQEIVAGYVLQKVDDEKDRLLPELLLKRLRSINDINIQYMESKELAKTLGISYQSLSKNRLIKRKIFNIVLFGKHYYLRESVDLFLSTGEGRFKLYDFLKPTSFHDVSCFYQENVENDLKKE